MSDLIIIGYDDQATAEKALAEVERLESDMLLVRARLRSSIGPRTGS